MAVIDIFFLIDLIIVFFSWLAFSLFTMRRIEESLKNEGIRTAQWDGIGVRAFWYAWAIFFHGTRIEQEDDILIDTLAVNRHATKRDRIMAGVMIISTGIFALGSVAYFLIQ